MTVTEELRRLLDECGVEWDYGIAGATTTRFTVNGVDLTFTPMRDGLVCSTILTPEQAIAATLGRGTCKVTNECKCSACGWQYPCSNYTTYTTCDGRTAYRPSWRYYNDCGRVNFCPNCGRKVVDDG